MNNKVRFRITGDLCTHEKRAFSLSIILFALTLFIIGYLSYILHSLSDYRDRVEVGLNVSAGQVGDVSFHGIENEQKEEFFRKIYSIDGLIGMGYVENNALYSVEELSFLHNIQKGHVKGVTEEEFENTYEGCFQTNVVNATLWESLNIELSEGKTPSEYSVSENNCLMYLAEDFRSVVEIDEKYYLYKPDGGIITEFTVAGFYSDSTRIFDSRVLLQETTDSVGYYLPEYSIILVYSFGSEDGMFVCEEGKYDEVVEQFYALAEEYSADISVYSTDAIVSKAESNDRKIVSSFLEISILLSVSALVMVICSQTIGLLSRSRDFGVWLSNGATKKDLSWAFIYQNMLRLIIALPIAGTVLLFMVKQEAWDVETNDMVVRNFWSVSVPSMILIGIIIVVLSSVIPLVILKKTPVTNMLAGET